MRLNERQQSIYNKLKEILEKGAPIPTVAELGQMFGITQQAMSKNLKALEKAELIVRDPNKRRSIELVEPPPQAVRIPLLGRIAAGQPLEPVESQRYVEVPANQVPRGQVYALEVQGQSMIEDGILNGDIVIIRRQTMAFNGQTVVAVVNDEATLKRYYHEGDRIRLQPANATLSPIYASPEDAFEIRGVVYALYRRFEEANPSGHATEAEQEATD
ncbi:transcriptional repressor LexA [Sulfidibacter corallicola]|uniref:LexA repressor n=1 Tax=Sulfidibacter corallicola TaxID=2818388 RepID=A0A8A4TS88_SULCO|nr:transcriptional repressor LexA [Sulfidibacter corallicola]QTD51891.1 repressor LexA [Sulfidibacter corallicola]